MYKKLASLVRAERARLGIDQAELARRVGVGQQSVSRWERGTSRPRRSDAAALARALDLEVGTVLAAAGYVNAAADSPEQASQAVRPLVRSLPLQELTPERFEDLVAEIAQFLYPGGHASRFGGTGEKQYGIDVLVDGSTTATFQCKRRLTFGPADVRKAISEVVTPAASNYLFLTRTTATAAARLEVLNHPGWELWDGEGIARLIRTRMPKDLALRLVDTYFPGWREPFLGVSRPGPWLTTEEFYARASGDQLYTHDWNLVGRDEQLRAVISGVSPDASGLSLVIGRGDSGKTRLLKSVAEALAANGDTIRFLPTSTAVRAEDFELLPASGPLVLVVDDAHDRSDVAEVWSGLRRHNGDASLVLATRPYGYTSLGRDLLRVGIQVRDLPTVQLGDLKRSDAEALAREALGDAPEATVRRLAALTQDSPLATVVGGGLIRRGLLDPLRLEQSTELRTEILRGFRDALVAEPTGDIQTRRDVLDAVAALQPFRSDDQAFRDTVATIVGIPFDRVVPHLTALEDAGILLRRDSSLRIVPDLLGDVVLAQAAFDDRTGAPTGFLERAYAGCTEKPATHLFVNACRVDWQVGQQRDEPTALVTSLWAAIQQDLEKADVRRLLELVELLRRVAYFQPERALGVIHWIIEHPTTEVHKSKHTLLNLFEPTWSSVIQRVPPVLQMIAYDTEYMEGALDLLWRLAQDDQRATNHHPEHPVHVLRDLAEYDSVKPIEYNRLLLDIVKRWFDDALALSPLEILEPLLATEGSSQSYDAYTLTFRPYAIRAEAVEPLRQEVVRLALSEVSRNDLHRALAGVRTIAASLRYPSGTFGRPVTAEERAHWTPGMVSTIEAVEGLLQEPGLDPVIAVALMPPLHSIVEYGTSDETRRAAAKALESLPDTLRFRAALSLHDGWGELVRERGMSHEDSQTLLTQRMREVVQELENLGDDNAVVDLIEERLDAEDRAFGGEKGNPTPLVAELVDARPSIGKKVIERVLAVPSRPLSCVLSVVISRLVDREPDEVIPRANALLRLNALEVTRAVADAFSWGRGRRADVLPGEAELIKALALNADPYVRRVVVRAAERIAQHAPHLGIDLLARVPFADSTLVADDVFSTLSDRRSIEWGLLSPAQQETILAQLIDLDDIGEYWITQFLAELSGRDPRRFVGLAEARIEKASGPDSLVDYRPLPFHWDSPLKAREHPDFTVVLQEIRDWTSAAGTDRWVRGEAAAELFWAVAGPCDESVLTVLREGLASPVSSGVPAVTILLGKAPRELVLGNPDFVALALESAARYGKDALRAMRGSLWSAVVSGIRSGAPGQPFQEDIDQRDRAEAIAATYPAGSLPADFYTSLKMSAEDSIRHSLDGDERRGDGRDW